MRRSMTMLVALLCCVAVVAADREVYLKHSSGMVAGRRSSDGRAVLMKSNSTEVKKLKLREKNGYYLIVHTDGDGKESYMTLNGSWNTYFEGDANTDKALFSIIGNIEELFQLKNKSNGKFVGTDSNDADSPLFSDKSGGDTKHYWYVADKKDATLPEVVTSYIVAPTDLRQKNEGWGVSLCWWANMCGKWSDKKIDQIVDWLTSPTGLNFNIFRYNIGGGDDPKNRHCDKHHMGYGKGLRAEMEGFKTSTDSEYDWTADEAQRKIMLKIREKRPDAIFEAFSNSAPYYMTYSGCCAGNEDGNKDNLKPEYYEEFAHYLVDVCKHYKDEYGIEFKTLEPFNEPITNFWHANGVQEGCHFDASSQVAFIKVLHPILEKSGLSTVISASDETNVGTSVFAFEQYRNDGKALKMTTQWNTHTYGADNVSRSRLGTMCREAGKTLWMSETGSGGNGIGGNLSMAQRMFDDIRYMLPAAWVDWQYVEENNDQWCLVKGNFSAQSYEKVKNFYVRQQVTRHIKQGYTFVTSLSTQSLAAVNEAGDTLVLVTLNTSASAATHNVRLAGCVIADKIECYQTSPSKSHTKTTTGFKNEDDALVLSLPAQSITTYIIPIKRNEVAEIAENEPYMIVPQYNTETALTADNRRVTIEKVKANQQGEDIADKSQTWYLQNAGSSLYTMKNGNGEVLTGTTAYALTTETKSTTGQTFSIEKVDGEYYKLTSSKHGKSLDLNNASSSPSTQVGLWAYGTDISQGHRNWQLLCIAPYNNATDIKDIDSPICDADNSYHTLQGIRIARPQHGVYIHKGKKVLVK